MTTTFNPELMENQFQGWYSGLAKSLGLPPDPDAPGNDYNYRAAWIYGQHTGKPIPGPDNQFPATFLNNAPPVSPGQMVGLPEIIAQGQQQQAAPQPQWAGPPPVQWAEPPKPQFSERFNQVAAPPVSAPASQPLTLGGKPAIDPPGGKWVLDGPAAPGQGGRGVDLSEIKLDQPAGVAGLNPGQGGQQKPMDIKGFRQTYPQYNDMTDQELSDRLYQKYYSDMDRAVFDNKLLGAGAQAPTPQGGHYVDLSTIKLDKDPGVSQGGQFVDLSTIKLDPVEDPMAAQVNMLDPVGAVKELGKLVAEHGPALGTMATAAATKIPGVVAAPITGILVAAGGLLNRAHAGKDTPITPEEQALMDAGLPFATGDMGRDFLTGVGAEFGGRGIAWGAGKLLAPAAGKTTDAGRSFMEFAKKNNLPYSPDAAVAPIWRSQLAQGLADTGIGKWFTNRQRGELVQGASEAAGKVLDDLGLPAPLAPTEAARDLANYLRQLSNKKLTHAQFNEAMARIPAEAEMSVPNLMSALEEIGGLKTVSEMYAGKSGHAPREFGLLKRVINRDGVITKDEIDYTLIAFAPVHML